MVSSRFFRNSLILILMISSLPGIILGGAIYWFAVDRLDNNLLELHKNQIVQRAASIDEQFHLMENFLSHWAFDSKFGNDLINSNFFRDFEISRDITKTLNALKGANPLTKQAEMFIQTPQLIRFVPEYDFVSDASTIQQYVQLLDSNKPFYWTNWVADPQLPDSKDLTLVHQIPGGSTKPFGALLFRLDQKKLSELLSTLLPYSVGNSFMMLSDGTVLGSTIKDASEGPFEQLLKENVLQSGSKDGSFVLEWKDTKYTVSYGSFNRIGLEWTYVSASPIGMVTESVMFVSKFIMLGSVAVFIAAVILSWLASRRIYSPIDRLVQMLAGDQWVRANFSGHHDEFKVIEKEWLNLTRESLTLQNKLEKQLPQLKKGFLLQLVQGYLYAYSEKDLNDSMRSFGWEMDNRQLKVMHIQLTGFSNLEGRFSSGDEGLVTFAAANIVEELFSSQLEQVEVINFHNLSIGVLIMLPSGQPYQEILQNLSQDVLHTINRILKLHVSIMISKTTNSIVSIPLCYEDAKQALSYRNFENESQIIDLEALVVDHVENEQYYYPFMLEREIVHFIHTSQQEETLTLIAAFLNELRSHGAKELDVQQCMLQLLGSILHTVRHMRIDPGKVFQTNNLYEQLTKIREPEKMMQWFRDQIVLPLGQAIVSRSDEIKKKTVEIAIFYVEKNYMKDISLESCAEQVGMHPVILSKSFKQVAGKNFIDYLTELRLDKAKELLRNTDLKINEIADQVGYQHSYLNRIFKKQVGLTPSLYREQSRNSD